MKLTAREVKAVTMLRKLDSQQRDGILDRIQRTLLSNGIVARAGRLKKVEPVADHRIVKAYGVVPHWRVKK